MDKRKVAVVTGGARGIGKAIREAFASQGVFVCTIDNDCGWTYTP